MSDAAARLAAALADRTAHKWYADLLMMTGRGDAALIEVQRALALDPLSPNILAILGEVHWSAGRNDEAMAALQKGLELDPQHPLLLELASRLYWQRGDMEHFFAIRERLEPVSPRVAPSTAVFRRTFASGGRTAVLRAQLAAPAARLLPSERARWHAELGDMDAAFRDLDDALARRDVRLAYETYFADCALLWKDPRWASVLQRMGVEEYARR